jgi:hypothetical protein
LAKVRPSIGGTFQSVKKLGETSAPDGSSMKSSVFLARFTKSHQPKSEKKSWFSLNVSKTSGDTPTKNGFLSRVP